MITTLSTLESSVLETLVDIESNMIPLLAVVGINITRNDIKDSILKDPDQVVVIIFKKEQVSAFLRYSRANDHLFIKSIEVTQIAGALGLRKLFREALPAFREETVSGIESVVQASNQISIRMHEKLGFKRAKENPKAIRYRVERLDLITKVERMVRS